MMWKERGVQNDYKMVSKGKMREDEFRQVLGNE